MKISILTLFPEMFSGPFASSILKKAQQRDILSIEYINIRDFATDNYKSVDDHPYGGGVGMVLRVDVIDRALQSITCQGVKYHSILLDPQGEPYTQKKARALSKLDHLILVCGHYEGVDERIRGLVDEEISIGDFVLTGGEIPAMAVIDSVVRLIPDVLREDATLHESFERPVLEYPQYTRPETYKGRSVPHVLLSGNHKAIALWRQEQSLKRTSLRRPDLTLKGRKGSL